jgi:hypothetical protein
MEQEIRVQNRAPERVSGTWEFEGDLLTLKPCLRMGWKEPDGRIAGCIKGVAVTPLGGVEIAIDSQYGLAYRKAEKP